MFETILTMATTTVVFLIGINVGYKFRSNEKPVCLPKMKEIKKMIPITKEYQKEQHNQEEIERLNIIMRNLENYDGTSNGQMEVK